VLNLPHCIRVLTDDDEAIQEKLTAQLVQNWLQRVSAHVSSGRILAKLSSVQNLVGAAFKDADMEQPSSLRSEALRTLLDLATATEEHPRLALGLGQALHSFFWWGHQPQGVGLASPSVQVMRESLSLHERALAVAGCDLMDLELEEFLLRKCPWRWRFTFLIGSELGLELARGGQDFRAASEIFDHVARRFAELQRLPFFVGKTASPMRLNQNADFFPTARHWPIWARERWPDFANFIERPIGSRCRDAAMQSPRQPGSPAGTTQPSAPASRPLGFRSLVEVSPSQPGPE